MQLVHGGDVEGYRERYGCDGLDFSANVSPLGLPEGVKQAAAQALKDAQRYPDPLCRQLRGALAAKEGLLPDEIFCGSGAADLIWRLALALGPAKAVVPSPTFAEYEAALTAMHWQIERVAARREEAFAIPVERMLAAIRPGVKLVFLCQPNNPTGVVCPKEGALQLLSACRQVGAKLVVDECFVEFLDNPSEVSLAGLSASQPSLVRLCAFTKTYAMAGLRLGWLCCADPALIEALYRSGQPWAVSNVAQAAGIAALQEKEYLASVRNLVMRERPRMCRAFQKMGIKAVGSANFLFFTAPVKNFCQQMEQQGILVRNCENYPGLAAGDCRVAVRAPQENDRLLAACARILEGSR